MDVNRALHRARRNRLAGVVEEIRRFARGGRTAIVATISGDANVAFLPRIGEPGDRRGRDSGHVAVDQRGRTPRAQALQRQRPFRGVELSACVRKRARTANLLPNGAASPAKADAVTNDPMEATWIGFQAVG